MTVAGRSVRRLRRGGLSVEIDYDASHVLLACTTHGVDERLPLVDGDLGIMLVRFFRDHQACSPAARFEIDDQTARAV